MEKIKNAFRKIDYNSPVILTFVILSFAAYLLSVATADLTGGTAMSKSNILLFSVYRCSLADPLAYIRVFGHVLGHAGIDHYLGNMMLILLIGPMLEEKYGSKNMLISMLFTALITGLVNILIFPETMLLGASGIVFMMMLLSSFVNLKKGRIPLTLLLCIIVFIGREVVAGIANQDNISNFAHIIGGLCGAGFGYFLNRRKFSETETK